MRRRWLVILLVGLFCLAGVAGAQELDEEESEVDGPLNATPRELAAGGEVTVSGDGCEPGEPVDFHFYVPQRDTSVTLSAPAGSDGTFSAVVNVPIGTPPGRVWLHSSCPAPDSEDGRLLQAVLLISRPEFAITWTNILLGVGSALVVAGLGLSILREASARRRRRRANPMLTGHRFRDRRSRKRKAKRRSGHRS